MRQKLFLFIFLILLLHSGSNLRAQSGGWIHSYSAFGNVLCFTHAESKLWAADGNAVVLSTDNGMDWSAPDSGHSPTWVSSIASDGTRLYAAIGPVNQSGYGVARSTDNGKSWTRVTNGFENNSAVYAVAISGSNVIAGSGGIFLSTDSGVTWQIESNGTASTVKGCSYLLSVGANVLAVTNLGLLISSDNGITWAKNGELPIQEPIGSETFQPLAISGSKLFACNGSDSIFLSSDNGVSWKVLPSHFPDNANCIAANDSILFAGFGSSGPIEYSTNMGLSWVDFGYCDRLSALIVSGPNLVYGSDAVGINYWPISEILGQNSGVKMSDGFNMIEISPNPTSGLVTVHGESVSHITITNLLGQSLIEVSNPGAGSFTLDLSKLPAGTYYARFASERSVETKMIVKE